MWTRKRVFEATKNPVFTYYEYKLREKLIYGLPLIFFLDMVNAVVDHGKVGKGKVSTTTY